MMIHDETFGSGKVKGFSLDTFPSRTAFFFTAARILADLGSPNAPSDGAPSEAQLPFKVNQAFKAHVTTGVVTPGAGDW